MTQPPVLLSFSARALDEHAEDQACLHALQYDTLQLEYHTMGLPFLCELPFDAQLGDSIALYATSVTARSASFSAEAPVTKQALDTGHQSLTLKGQGESGEYIVQLSLVGLHGMVKNTVEYNAYINNTSSMNRSLDSKASPSVVASAVKRHTTNLMASLLAIF
ncbi:MULTISPECIES: hypothetical protein [Pseudoalteromonas]|uniref:Uncharacterized protein n=1 Tax=Pseudoalteromonas amylolytica TaxID=1859457 RepID=A0A1S1MKC5_9GAMM|nr:MULTISPECIES: hypothetical protein [Pseudoalteromonas]MCF6437249.1 hypothetical protein [Pseudoalteromonas sp. MMG022]OHU84351.1 hypothetical protein BFC16_01555 [Pseudoalteromonas sp. JW3]OHU87110.1 hypothetical protein BET10_00385 [Pseudoalteromonas amylolytica]